MYSPSKTSAPGDSPASNVLVTTPSLARTTETELPTRFATQIREPSDAIAIGRSPTAIVFGGVLPAGSIRVTLLLNWLATQTKVPSKRSASGPLPTSIARVAWLSVAIGHSQGDATAAKRSARIDRRRPLRSTT